MSDLKELAKKEQGEGSLSLDELEQINAIIDERDEIEIGANLREAASEQEQEGDLRAQIRDMTLPQKMKCAMFGNQTCRMLLVTDSNRLIQEAVLKNPQLQEREVHDFAKNKNMPENVLRRISDSKTWMKSYQLKLLLTNNPKTPLDLALKWVRFLRAGDLKRLGGSKNVSQVVANAAKKRAAELQKKR